MQQNLDNIYRKIKLLRQDLEEFAEINNDAEISSLSETSAKIIEGIEEAFLHYSKIKRSRRRSIDLSS